MGAAEELLGEIVHSPRTNVPENLRFGQGRDQVHGGAPKEAQKCKDFVVLNLIAVEISIIKKLKLPQEKLKLKKCLTILPTCISKGEIFMFFYLNSVKINSFKRNIFFKR
jgi:hypothetical protein